MARNQPNSLDEAEEAVRHSPISDSVHRGTLLCSLLVIALLGRGRSCPALEPSTPLASYGRQAWVLEDGLPQNTVLTPHQSRDGVIWLGTEGGLVRFDGNRFQVFDRNSSPALPGNDVRCLLQT